MPSASASAQACSGPGAAEGDQRSRRGSTPALDRHRPQRPLHGRVDHRDHALGRHAGPAERRRAPRRRRAGRCRRSSASGGDAAGDEVGVGDRRLGAAAAVAGGPGHGAGRLRGPTTQRAARVEAGDRAAAGADRVDVERREPDRVAADRRARPPAPGAPPSTRHTSVLRAAHVEGDGVGEPVGGGDRGRRPAPRPPVPTAAARPAASAAASTGTSPPAEVITSTSPASAGEPLAGTTRQRGRR